MIVTGITSQLRSEAERKCAGCFLAWLGEMRKGQWRNWPDLLRHYPRASRTDGNEAHFPLAPDGSGIRAAVIFNPGVLRLLRIAPSPAARRQILLSHPKKHDEPHTTL